MSLILQDIVYVTLLPPVEGNFIIAVFPKEGLIMLQLEASFGRPGEEHFFHVFEANIIPHG